ncbi:hypothetical protein LguiA_014299 [Lonicera macranthoides]
MVAIIMSAELPNLRPPHCSTQENCKEASASQLWVLYIALLLTALGIGGIRPCVVTFAADQFDMSKAKREARVWNLFNWYYFCMGLAGLIALTLVVYVQDHVGWGWGLGIPTIAMGVSVVAFVVGSPLYMKVKPEGSPLVRLAQVFVAAVRKRKEVAPMDHGLLYENRELDAVISLNGRLLHTNQLKWFDRAAIVTNDGTTDSSSPNPWKLATVHRVEELKSIIRILPIWASGILVFTAFSHQHSFTVQQARTMDRHLSPSSSFQIPPASLTIFSVLTLTLGLALYERLFVPFARKFTKNPMGITYLQRIGVGLVANILSTSVSALVESKRKLAASDHNLLDKPSAVIPISVFWMVPQFCLHGLAEVFMTVGILEFLYDQSAESMRSIAVALSSLSVSIGNYLGTFMVTLVHKYTAKESNWVPDRNLNRGRLEYYYWFVSGIQIVNLVYYVVCAWIYVPKTLEEVTERSNEGGLEVRVGNVSSNKPLDDARVNQEIV